MKWENTRKWNKTGRRKAKKKKREIKVKISIFAKDKARSVLIDKEDNSQFDFGSKYRLQSRKYKKLLKPTNLIKEGRKERIKVVSIGCLTAFYVLFVPLEYIPNKPPH